MADNRIVVENAIVDGRADKSYWDASTSTQIEGFARDISVNAGTTVNFSVNVNGGAGSDYKVEIFRLGYYGGSGAREVAEWTNTSATVQPNALYDASRALVDAGNWSVTDSWSVPSTAVSGVYLARLQRLDASGNPIAGATNQIPFIVRNDGVAADIVLQTSDTTWQAYNGWFGNNGRVGANFYGDASGTVNHPDLPADNDPVADRAYAVSYNRPIITRDGSSPASGAQDYLFGADYAAISWLEQNGYNVSYISGVDTDRLGADYLQNYKAYISVGHDEYWSAEQRANVEEARDAGVNVLFWSGNEVYWKTRWETSISADGTEYRTLVCYKETWANADPNAGPEDYANLDPSNIWTGTWRDMRFVEARDANGVLIAGGAVSPDPISGLVVDCHCVETLLTGQLFGPDGSGEFGGALDVPASFATLRVWRGTSIANGGQLDIAPGLIGYEWDTTPTDATRPQGLITLSESVIPWSQILIDTGNTTAAGVETHNLTLYRAPSGALVFGAGTVFWSWALSNQHDSSPYGANIASIDLQQMMTNVFADMGIQPGISDAALASLGLVRASASADRTAATASIDNVADTVAAQTQVTVTGTATDIDGNAATPDGRVAAVEVSVDGGMTWLLASTTNAWATWSYIWKPVVQGAYTILARAIDDSLNVFTATPDSEAVTVTAPVMPTAFSLFGDSSPSGAVLSSDGEAVELGMAFTVAQSGTITALKYWRAAGDANDIDTRAGHLWSSNGTLLGTVTFTSTAGQSGWQTAMLSTAVAVTAGQQYVVSYKTNDNYVATTAFFAAANEVGFDGLDNDAFTDPFGMISARQTGVAGNGLYSYGTGTSMPTSTYQGSNYWVDVLFDPAGEVNASPTITSPATYSVAENQTVVGTVTATDPENNPLTYSISGGVDAAKFTINATTGALAFASPPDFEAPTDSGANNVYNIIVSATDGLSTATTKAIAVTVTNVTEAPNASPTITSPATYTVAENQTVVGTVTATDPEGNPLLYAITGGADAALFTIDSGTGALAFVSGRDFETPTDAGGNNVYDVIVRASDGASTPATRAIAVTVTNVAEAEPTNLFTGTPAGSETEANDYELGTKFTANADGQVTSLRYYRTSADSGDIDTRTLNLWTTGGTLLGSATVSSAAGATGWQVATLATAVDLVAGGSYIVSYGYDQDGVGDAYAYTSGYFASARSSADGTLTAPISASPTGVSTGGIGNGLFAGAVGVLPQTSYFASAYWVDVNFTPAGTNTPPVFTSSASFSAAENQSLAGAVTATDANNDALTYSIVGGVDAARFVINASTGMLSFAATPDFEAPADADLNNVYALTVAVSDGRAAAVQRAMTVTVTDVADANASPTITSAATYAVAENQSAVGTITATDAENNPLVYSISGGADAAKFTINASTGALAFVTAPDFEAPGDAGANNVYDVIVQASDGISAPASKAVAVTVTNVADTNTPPTITSAAAYSLAENLTAIGTVTATDPENDPLVYSISGGADAAKFTINASTGALAFVAAPDFEAPGDAGANNVYDVIVQASDGVTSPATKAVAVTVTNSTVGVTITGTSGNDTVTPAQSVAGQPLPTGEADVISTLDGNDTLNGGTGADTLIGGSGNDTYVTDGGDTITEAAGAGTDLVQSSVTLTLGTNLENLTLTGAGAISGTGNDLANLMTGNTAANRLTGGNGNDTLNGGTGSDTLVGGAGNDTYVTDGGDTITETSGAGTDLVQSSVTLTLGTNMENLTLTGAAAINGTGNSLSNLLTGNNAANVLTGSGGADTMVGGLGDDTYVTDGGDTLTEASGAGVDLVRSTVTLTLGANLENLTLTGSSSIGGTGNELANLVIGNSGGNLLNGGAGADTLTGGSGSDTFVFNTALGGGNVDRITDYSAVSDTVRLDDAIFTGLSLGTLSSGAYRANTTGLAGDSTDRIMYETDTGNLFFDVDGTGAGAAFQFAIVSPNLALTFLDFVVV